MVYVIILIIIIFLLSYLFKKFEYNTILSPKGKAVFITGCDSGIGNRLAQKLNEMGFKVYATVLNINNIGAQELKRKAIYVNKMNVLEMNVTNESQVNDIYEYVKNDLKESGYQLWSVVNNAALITAGLLEWGTLETYRQIFEVNVFGTIRVTRVFLPLIKISKGRFIMMNSISGYFSFNLMGIYSMTKHSLIAFTEALRRELAQYNIEVCSIEPGYINTNLSSKDNLVKILNSVWNKSSNEVKLNHLNPDKQIKKILDFKYNSQLSAELDIVVDDIIDSITRCCPKPIYKPMTLIFKCLMFILKIIPLHICDKLMQ